MRRPKLAEAGRSAWDSGVGVSVSIAPTDVAEPKAAPAKTAPVPSRRKMTPSAENIHALGCRATVAAKPVR